MSELLVGDLDRADALVDLSNVLRDISLGGRGPADLVRLGRVGAALAALYGSATATMFAVADTTLLARRDLFADPGQRRRLREWEESGLVHVAGKADIPLLRIAEETGLPIITRDRFGGHRREFPWLDGSDDAILEPYSGRRGQVALRHVTLDRLTEWDESVRQERDLLVQYPRWWCRVSQGCRCPRVSAV